ncbi:hypothetical protein EJ110_NYTH29524 [Nymphaea thermarum]|nr:hypothetical protein EJ110_NYTH29524 [Nymphaea thermarum]
METENQRPLLNDNLGNADGGHGNRRSGMVECEGDIEPINSAGGFVFQFGAESKKLWHLAGPAIFTNLCRYSLGAVTQAFAGHLGTLELAAVSMENSVIGGFSFGVTLGMASALETICGQAYGAGQLDMLGIYMQRSWVILNSTALVLCIFYVFATPFLKLIGQATEIAESAGTFAIWMIPQLFAYSTNYPIAKFLQAQSKIMPMAAIIFSSLVLHTFFSWLLIIKLGWGLVGAAVVLDSSWWFIVIAQLVYIFAGTCDRAWTGFSWKAFTHLWEFFKLSLASSVMLCMNILGWTIMVAFGSSAAISVRVSNELGAGNPRRAKFAVVDVVISTFIIGLAISAVLLILRDYYPKVFTSSQEVQALVNQLTPLLALTIVIDSVQPVLSGVAIGAGWQAIVAYVNVGCYYGYSFYLNLHLLKGIWIGMTIGVVVQSLILFAMTYRTNWNKEATSGYRTWPRHGPGKKGTTGPGGLYKLRWAP